MKIMSRTVAVAVLLLSVVACWAVTDTATQTFNLGVNEVAKLKLGSTGTIAITINMLGTDHAGATPSAASSGSTYLQYTSIEYATALTPSLVLDTRTIQAVIGSGTLPDGTKLLIRADNGQSGGGALPGTGTPGVTDNLDKLLGDATGASSYVTQDIITGIGCCYTGTDSSDGAQIVHTLAVDDWNKIHKSTAHTVTVVYTLTQ